MSNSISKPMQRGIAVAIFMLAMTLLAPAQQNVQAAPDGETGPGKMADGYVVQQYIEFGGRITDVSGNHEMYDTLINLHDGPRLLGQELIMRSPTRDHGLFDSLYLNSYGYGGDPNDMTRLRIEKGRWYDFVGLYRRDENFFDFNLFANPLNLNPGIGRALQPFPAVPVNTFDPKSMPWFAHSPHLQDTTRNMGDFNLTLFPDSKVRIRLGYARNVTDGRLDTTLETPIRSILTEHDRWRSDRYQFGIDVSVLKRTTISFDQFFEHDKVDPNFIDGNLSFTVGGVGPNAGSLIDIGVVFPPSGCTPGAGTFTVVNGVNVYTPTIAAPACNVGLFNFQRSGRVRTDIPTSQLSFASNYFRKLDITGSGTYSSGSSDFGNLVEFANGFGTSTVPANKVPILLLGASHADRVSGNADLGLTYHFTRAWSASDKFRWLSWRDPGRSHQEGFNCGLIPTPGLTSADCQNSVLTPTSVFGLPANPANPGVVDYLTFIGERTFENTAKVRYDALRFGGYVGYRYQRRELTGSPAGDSATLNSYYLLTNGDEEAPRNTTRINEHTALAGVMFRPTPAWRINGDVELLSADNFFTNIGPRHQQRFRINTVYKVNRWSSINGSVHFVETRNDFATQINASQIAAGALSPNLFPTDAGVPPAYGHKDHWRYYTFGASLNPDPRFSLDFGWTYLDTLFISATCVPIAAGTSGVIILPGTNTPDTPPGLCFNPNNTPPTPPSPFPASFTADVPLYLNYQERTNTGFVVLTVRPVHRVALNFGYEITSTAGYNRWLLAGGTDGNGELLVLSDIFGNSPRLPGNPTPPPPFPAGNPIGVCPAPAITVTSGCAFPGPFPDAPLSQALNWHKPYAGISVDITKQVTFKGLYAYYDYNEKETRDLPEVNQRRDFHANVGTLSLKYAF